MKKVSYGKIVEARQEGTTVFIRFENGELEVTAYTDFIIRIFSDFSGVRPACPYHKNHSRLHPEP